MIGENPKPQIPAELRTQLREAIEAALNATVAQQQASNDFIYRNGTEIDSQRARKAAAAAQTNLWRLLFSNSEAPDIDATDQDDSPKRRPNTGLRSESGLET